MSAVVAVLLRSPLHRLASRRRLLLSAEGSRWVVGYHRRDDGALVLLGATGAPWASVAGPVEVVLRGRRVAMTAEAVADGDRDEAVQAYLQANPRDWMVLGVGAQGTAEDVAAAASEVTLVRLVPG